MVAMRELRDRVILTSVCPDFSIAGEAGLRGFMWMFDPRSNELRMMSEVKSLGPNSNRELLSPLYAFKKFRLLEIQT